MACHTWSSCRRFLDDAVVRAAVALTMGFLCRSHWAWRDESAAHYLLPQLGPKTRVVQVRVVLESVERRLKRLTPELHALSQHVDLRLQVHCDVAPAHDLEAVLRSDDCELSLYILRLGGACEHLQGGKLTLDHGCGSWCSHWYCGLLLHWRSSCIHAMTPGPHSLPFSSLGKMLRLA
jgi:hypothetical protein